MHREPRGLFALVKFRNGTSSNIAAIILIILKTCCLHHENLKKKKELRKNLAPDETTWVEPVNL